MSTFLKYALGRDTSTAVMESALLKTYAYESCEYDITMEDFKQKLKNAGKKVADTIRAWLRKIKEFFKSVWAWITRHWNAFVAKFKGKKEIPDPAKMEAADKALIHAHNCIVKANAATDAKVAEAAMAEAKDYFDLANDNVTEANEHQVEAGPEEVKKAIQVRQRFITTGEQLVEFANSADQKRGEYIRDQFINKARAAGVWFIKLCSSFTRAVVGKTDDPAVDDKANAIAEPAAATA